MGSRVLIVEDDVIISEVLRQIVEGEGHQVVGVCSDEETAKEKAQFMHPDFALLDIKLLRDDLGTNVARELNSMKIPFAFITSYADKATIQEAVLLGPKGYLLKPFEKAEVTQVLEHLSNSVKQTIPLKSMGVTYVVDVADIKYVKSDNVYLEVHTLKKKYLARQKMQEFSAFLSPKQFIRVHQSYLVNSEYITCVNQNQLMIDDVTIPISRKYKKDVIDLFQ